jgi:hypothetical protein
MPAVFPHGPGRDRAEFDRGHVDREHVDRERDVDRACLTTLGDASSRRYAAAGRASERGAKRPRQPGRWVGGDFGWMDEQRDEVLERIRPTTEPGCLMVVLLWGPMAIPWNSTTGIGPQMAA